MAIQHVMAAVPTADYEAARAWYEQLFGRPPDVIVKDDESMWQLAQGGWVYLVADSERAGTAMLTLMVDDVEAHAPGEEIETVPGSFRRAVLSDPDGNRIAIGQDLSS